MKRKFKLISLVLCLSIFFSAITPISVQAANTVDYSNCQVVFYNSSADTSGVDGEFPAVYSTSSIKQKDLAGLYLKRNFGGSVNIKRNDTVTITLNSWENGRYLAWEKCDLRLRVQDPTLTIHDVYGLTYTYDRSTGIYVFKFTSPADIDNATDNFELYLKGPSTGSNVADTNAYFRITSLSITSNDKDEENKSNFFKNIGDWFKSVFEWLGSIVDNLKEGFTKLGNFLSNIHLEIANKFSDLFNKLGSWFASVIDNISNFFRDLTNNLKTWFANIGQWFSDIGDRIASFFEKLWNRIWWGNENGASEYEKPVINNKLNDILDKLEEYQENLKSAISTINSAAEDVSSYISTGTKLVNGVIGVAGTGFTALIVFGIVFILVRKVVGR